MDVIRVGIVVSIGLGLLMGGCASKSTKVTSEQERAALWVDAASGHLAAGDPVLSMQALAKAEELAPKMSQIYHVRALALYAKKDTAAALVQIQKALDLEPDSAAYLNTYGKMLLDEGKLAEAEGALLKASKDHLFRETFKPKTSLGILYYKQGRFAESRKLLEEAIALEPVRSCLAHYYRGHLGLREAKFSQATRDYDFAARKLCSNFADAHIALGIAYERNKEYDKARRKFLDVQAQFPDTAAADQAIEHLRYLP